jgi:hypothetical protein
MTNLDNMIDKEELLEVHVVMDMVEKVLDIIKDVLNEYMLHLMLN